MKPYMHFHRHGRPGGRHPGHGAGQPEARAHEHGGGHGPCFGRGRHGGHDGGFGREGGRGGPFGGRGDGGWGRGPWGGRGRGGPFGPWGDPGERRERLERGLLRHLLLDALRDGPRHGYEIIKGLEERTGGRYSPSPGTVYPTLQLLEDQKLVENEQQDTRRVYRLTDAGRAELEAHADAVAGFWSRFGGDADPRRGHEAAFLRDELGDLMRTVRRVAEGADEATIRAVREAIERCERDIRDLVARRADAAPAAPSEPAPPAAEER